MKPETRRLLILLFTAFVDMVGFIIIWPLLPYYATDFGANAAMVGLLVSAFSVAQLLSAAAWGRFSDIRGRRPAILLGLLISAGAYVVFAFSRALPLLFVSRLIQGIGGGTIGVVQAYTADTSDPDQRAKSLGWLSAATSLGAMIGPAIGSLLLRVGGRAAPGLGAAILCLALSVFVWRFLEEPERASDTGEHTATHPVTGRAAIWKVVREPKTATARLIWIYTIAIGAFYGTGQLFPLLMKSRLAVSETNIGYFVMYMGGIGLLVRSTILGTVVKRLGEKRLCRLGLLLLGAGLMLIGVAFNWTLLMIALTLMALGTAFTFPCVTALLTRAVRSRERGLYLGVQATFGGIARVAFPVAAGFAIDRFGQGAGFLVSGALVMATIPLVAGLEEPHGVVPVVNATVPGGESTGAAPSEAETIRPSST